MKKCIWNLPQLAVRSKFGHHIISNSRVALPSVSLHITLLIEVGCFDRLFWKPAKPDALAIAFAKGFLGLKFCRFIFLKKFGHQPEIRQNHTSCMIFLAHKSTVSNLPTFLSILITVLDIVKINMNIFWPVEFLVYSVVKMLVKPIKLDSAVV